MSVSISVYGIIPVNEKYRKMKQIYDLCKDNDVEIPDEVLEFFNYGEPDERGMLVELKQERSENCYEYIVDLDEIPESVKFIKCCIC